MSHTMTTTARTPARAVLRSKPSTELREPKDASNHRSSTFVEKACALASQLFSSPSHPIPLLPGSPDLGSSITPQPLRSRAGPGPARGAPCAAPSEPLRATRTPRPGTDRPGATGKGLSLEGKEEGDARMRAQGDREVRGGG